MTRLPIKGVYEVAVRVRNLDTSEAFYRGVLGLEVGLRDERRRWVFLRAGGAGMIVLQEHEIQWPKQHFAFAIDEKDIDLACERLTERDVVVEGPVFHEWMPARSIYFVDPDGHELELCAMAVLTN